MRISAEKNNMAVRLNVCFSDLILAGIPVRVAWRLSRGSQFVTPFGESCLRSHVKSSRRWWWSLVPTF